MGACGSTPDEVADPDMLSTLDTLLHSVVLENKDNEDAIQKIACLVAEIPHLGAALGDYYWQKEKETRENEEKLRLEEQERRDEEEKKLREEEMKLERELEGCQRALKATEEAKEREALLENEKKVNEEMKKLANMPPPVVVSQIMKKPGSSTMNLLVGWQRRVFVIEKGIVYFYESLCLDENKRRVYPYGNNIKGYFSLRGVKLFTDLDDMKPNDIVLRKYYDEDKEIVLEKDSGGNKTHVKVGFGPSDITLQTIYIEKKMELVAEFRVHIKYANDNDIKTPPPGDDERTLPLVKNGGAGRFIGTKKHSRREINVEKSVLPNYL